MPGSVVVGTSGWSYEHWDGVFYPPDVAHSRRLDYYMTRFPAVEVNYTFYRVPRETTVRSWHDAAPPGFRYAVKGSRYITHVLRLKNARESVGVFMGRVAGLKSFLGPVLWQLPPTIELDLDLLQAFLGVLPREAKHAVEFRHESWMTDDTFEALDRNGIAHVCVSSEQMPTVMRGTGGFVYVRFHGLDTGYDYDYTEADLKPWVTFLRAESANGRDGYVFFNNDAYGNAPRDADAIIGMLGDATVPWGEC